MSSETSPLIEPTGPVPGGGSGPVPSEGAGGGGAAPAAPARADEPAEYSFLAMAAITEMCNNFEEVIKGQSNRELLSDFKNLLESAVTLTLGHGLGGAVKPKNASDAQMTRALGGIVQGMILEKKLEGTRQEEKMEAMMESGKFEGIVECMPEDRKVQSTTRGACRTASC